MTIFQRDRGVHIESVIVYAVVAAMGVNVISHRVKWIDRGETTG